MKKRIIAVLVGVFLAFNTFGGQMVTAAGEGAEDEKENIITEEIIPEVIEDSTVTKTETPDGENPTVELPAGLVTVKVTNNGNSITDGAQISKDTVFRADYAFDTFNVDMSDEGVPSLKQGVPYALPGFNVVGFDLEATSYPITAEVEGQSGVQIGTLTLAVKDGQAKLSLVLNPPEAGTMRNAKAYFELKLAEDPNKSETKTLNLPDGSTYTFTIKEYVTTPPAMSFVGEKSGEDGALWTATITNGDTPKQYDDGYTFSVVLSKDEEYVDGTFKVGDTDVTPIIWDASTRTLSYSIQSPSYTGKGNTTISYKTKTSFELQQGVINSNADKISSTLTNVAKLVDNKTDQDITEEKSATVTQDKRLEHWLEKVPGKITKDGKIEWTITVNNNGYTLKNVTVFDKFLVEDGTMSLDGKVKVGDEEVDVTLGSDSDNCNWKYNLGTLSGTETKVLTYTTKIDNYSEYLKHNHSKKPTNTAWLTYEYDGFGKDTIIGPSLEKTAAVNLKAGIQISAENFDGMSTAYDPATHRLNWKVEANREYQDLKNVVITVDIPTGQGYVLDSISDVTYYNSDGTVANTEPVTPKVEDNKVIIPTISDIDSKKVSFTLQTELDNTQREIWSTNKGGTANNNAILNADNIKQSTDVDTITYVSDVLKTSISNYNYNDHTVDVTVTVDGNKMAMVDTLLTNKLHYDNYDLEVIEETLKVNGNSVTAQEITEENLVVNLGNISTNATDAVKIVTFKAKVISDNYTKVNNATFGINNKATLVTDDIKALSTPYVTETSNSITINNSVLIKTGSANKETGEAAYTVYINKAKNLIPANTVVTDVLGASLELDASSVKLFECEISDTDGSVLSEMEIACDKTVSTTSDGKTKLDVKIPATVGNAIKAYKLSYTAMLTDTAIKDCSNSIAMSYGATAIGNMTMNAYANFGAVGEFTKAAYIDIKAIDKEGNLIPGVEYHIVDKYGKVYASTITKADGTASIRTGKLTAGQNYILKPVNVPVGYKEVPEQALNNIKLGKAGLQSKDFEYAKKTTSIQVSTHIDTEGGKLIDGATVKVTKDGADYKSWKTSKSALTDLEWGHTYVITNPSAPNAYKTDKSTITLKVELNDDGKVIVVRDGQIVEEAKVVVATKNTANLTIDNVSSSQKNPVLGNTIVISTTEVPTEESTISTIVTDGTKKQANLPEGTYYIVETDTPVGFEKSPTKVITVNADGTIEEDGNVLEENELVIENDHNSEKYTATFTPEAMGINPSMFKAMKFTLYKKNNDKLEKVKPKNENTDEELVYYLDYQDEYIFVPEETLSGYKPVEPMTIRAMGTTPEDSKLQVKPKDADVFDDITVEEIGEKVKPQPVPVVVNNNNSSEHHHYYGPAKPANDELKDKEITALANTGATAGSANGARLAKTGGFLGTLTGYIAAVLLMLVGAYLVFGNRKRVK